MPAKRRAARKKPTAKKTRRPRSGRKSPPATSRGSRATNGRRGRFVTWEAIRRAFGNLIVMGDGSTHAASGIDKFQFIRDRIERGNTTEIFYLLASFVFDLHLRMVYVVEALQHVGLGDADPDFTSTVTSELREINGDPNLPVKDWESTARDAFTVMMRAHNRIHRRRQMVVASALR